MARRTDRGAARAAGATTMAAAVLLGSLGVVSSPVRAVIGAADQRPAATLLLPYFEVDLDDPNGITTVLSIDNVTSIGVLANVVLWTDAGIPAYSFNLYLTGYDSQAINLRDVFAGVLPVTADDGADPSDTVSPQGPLSQDVNYSSSGGPLPVCDVVPVNPQPANVVADLRAAFTGAALPSAPGTCVGSDYGDDVARGYLTVDTLTVCTATRPGDPGYAALLVPTNRLAGDFQLVNPAQNFAQSEPLLAVEADDADPRFAGPPPVYTFYAAQLGGSGEDRREPLGRSWALGHYADYSDVIVWRDRRRAPAPFPCASGGSAQWVADNEVVATDALGNSASDDLDNALAPLATQRIAVNGNNVFGDALTVGVKTGWFGLGFDHAGGDAALTDLGDVAQSVVIGLQPALQASQGRFATGFGGVQTRPVLDPVPAPIPRAGVAGEGSR